MLAEMDEEFGVGELVHSTIGQPTNKVSDLDPKVALLESVWVCLIRTVN